MHFSPAVGFTTVTRAVTSTCIMAAAQRRQQNDEESVKRRSNGISTRRTTRTSSQSSPKRNVRAGTRTFLMRLYFAGKGNNRETRQAMRRYITMPGTTQARPKPIYMQPVRVESVMTPQTTIQTFVFKEVILTLTKRTKTLRLS